MLSIIIPALNEEKYLPRLLDSLNSQDFLDFEIIVADAGSEDRTVEIAKKYKCIVVRGGNPAQGRNAGAKAAKGDIFLFLDADVGVEKQFLSRSLKEFFERRLGVASFLLFPEKRLHRLIFSFYNSFILLLEHILPHGAMGIMVKRDIFEKVGGFDPKIKIAEDMQFVRNAGKISPFGIFRSTYIFVSTRRFKTDGWIYTILRYLFTELHMILFGPIRSDIISYRFNHYSKNEKTHLS